MKVLRSVKKWFSEAFVVFRCEFDLVRRDAGVIIFFFGLPLLYPIVYTLIYNTETVRDLPIAVVDHCRTSDSRELTRHAEATSAMHIYSQCSNLGEARNLMAEGKVYGILEIPHDYADKIGRGETAHADFYCDMSLLLRYRAFLTAFTEVQLSTGTEITQIKMAAAGKDAGGMPIDTRSHFMGDPEEGYASFILPAIIILILHQSMLLGVSMVGATSRERKRYYNGHDPLRPECYGLCATVWGRTMVYFLCYVPMTIYILHWIPEIFSLPHYGSPSVYLLFIVPFLLATALLGQTLAYFIREREMAFLVFVFSSVVFIFLSGMIWPRFAMAAGWRIVGDFIPAVWGVEGFALINNNAATLPDVATPYYWLWGLVVLYFVAAVGVTAYLRKRPLRKFRPY